MFKNYLKIAARTLTKNKAYTLINVLGLALSMACGILIFTLVSFHLSFDNFHNNASRIYRFVTEEHRDVTDYDGSVPPGFAPAFRKDYTFGEDVARIVNYSNELININSGAELKKFKESAGVSFVEPVYFNIFNFPLLQGNIKTALAEPNTGIITQHIAEKYFGNENPINKTFTIERGVIIRVTGVLKNLPTNSDQKTEIFISFPTLRPINNFLGGDVAWGGISNSLQAFVRLRPGVQPTEIEKLLPAYVKKYRPKSKNVHHYILQPLAEMHFDARYGGIMEKRNLYILSFIALFIIITACVNFINLATAQALKRSREVGVRKVLGSLRSQLFWQFIAETGLITFVGMLLAVGLSLLALPYVNTLFNTQMVINVFTNMQLLSFLIMLAVVVTFLAGSYPGLILARFKPVAALKGKISGQNIGGFNTRRALIVTQFAISQMLVIGMIVIAVQMKYAKNSNLGFNKDAIVMVQMGADSTGASINTLKTEFAKIPGVENVSVCSDAPASIDGWDTNLRYNNSAEDEPFSISVKGGDNHYVPTFGLELVAGRNIFPADTVREFLVNEAFLRKLNIKSPNEVIGKTLAINGGYVKAPIVGVVKDFHDKSFHENINAICISSYKDQYGNFAIKINMRDAKSALAAIEKTWNAVYPTQIYDYKFLDEKIAEFYNTEETMLKLIQVFSFIAIFIGCLGLYGLVMFMASQKTKEIGIRKVLGSSIAQILWIFGKEFAGLIAVAFVIAAPIAAWLMSNWLQDFKFHINLSPLFFAATILLMFVIAFITVGYQATRAALMNPVKAIRTE